MQRFISGLERICSQVAFQCCLSMSRNVIEVRNLMSCGNSGAREHSLRQRMSVERQKSVLTETWIRLMVSNS